MRYPASDKLEIIRTAETSFLPVKRTLTMLGIPSSTYHDWYVRWVDGGLDALVDQSPVQRRCGTVSRTISARTLSSLPSRMTIWHHFRPSRSDPAGTTDLPAEQANLMRRIELKKKGSAPGSGPQPVESFAQVIVE